MLRRMLAVLGFLAELSMVLAVVDLDSFAGPATTTPFKGFASKTAVNPASPTYTTGSNSRLAFYLPGTTWSTNPSWLAFYNSLVMIGIPTVVTTNISTAIQHPVVLAYQSFTGTVSASDSATWTSYVASGKTLITTSLTTTDATMTNLFGVTGDSMTNSASREVIMLQNVASQPGVNYMSQINFTDTRDWQIPLWGNLVNKGFPTVGYRVTNTSVVSLGKYALHSSPSTTEATYSSITLNTVSSGGQAIAFGIDVGYYIALSQGNNTWGIPRDYAATYEPGYDTFLRLLKSMYAQTAYVTIWPVPSNMGVHFVWSYDIDAQDSWANAVTVSQQLKSVGIGGTINWQTKLVADAYDIDFFTQFYQNISLVESLGNMELASHSVSHSINLANFAVGTGLETYNTTHYTQGNSYWPFIGECTNNTGPYITDIPNSTYCDTPTDVAWFYTVGDSLIGEVVVSKFLLETISTKNSIVRSYRTGHLIFPNAMPDIWNQYGIKYTSSGASNDQNTFLPYQLFSNRSYYQPLDVYEFSMTSSDEDLSVENGCPINNVWAVPGDATYPQGSALFQQMLLVNKIAKYGGSYTFLLHPCSFGVDIPWATSTQLFSDKFAFQQAFIPLIQDVAYFDTMEGRGDFTKARINTGVDLVMNGSSVTVTVKIPSPIANLTLHFPTTWSLTSATTAVNVPVQGAVVLVGGVPAGTYTLTFTTASSTATPSAPSTTLSATYPVSTSAAATVAAKPTPTHIVVIDDFSNPVRYNYQNNSLGQYTYDDKTMREPTSVQDDWLFLAFSPSSYWYTLVGPPNVCNDYSAYTKLNIGLRFPFGVASAFWVNLQSATSGSCTAGTFSAVTVGPKSANAAITLQNTNAWQDISIPLTNFTGMDMTSLRAITFSAFATNGTMEVDYLTFT